MSDPKDTNVPESAPFKEIEGDDRSSIYLSCPSCENRIKKRRDSFIPGMHIVICVLCGYTSPHFEKKTGEVIEKTAADFQ